MPHVLREDSARRIRGGLKNEEGNNSETSVGTIEVVAESMLNTRGDLRRRVRVGLHHRLHQRTGVLPLSYHRSESEARKWLSSVGLYEVAFKLSNAEPADFLVGDITEDDCAHELLTRIKLVEVKSVRGSVWRLNGARQRKQFKELKAFSEAHGIPACYLVSLLRKRKRVWRFVSIEVVEREGKVVA